MWKDLVARNQECGRHLGIKLNAERANCTTALSLSHKKERTTKVTKIGYKMELMIRLQNIR